MVSSKGVCGSLGQVWSLSDVRCAVGAAGWLAWGGQHPTVLAVFGAAAGGQIETELLSAGDHTLGNVVLYSGRTSWLFMSLDDGRRSGKANCQVSSSRGKRFRWGLPGSDPGDGVRDVTLSPGTGRIETASVCPVLPPKGLSVAQSGHDHSPLKALFSGTIASRVYPATHRRLPAGIRDGVKDSPTRDPNGS